MTSRESYSDVKAKEFDCNLKESEFKLYFFHYVHFQTNTVGKCMNPIILPVMG